MTEGNWAYLNHSLEGRMKALRYTPVAVMPGSAAFLYRADVYESAGLTAPPRLLPRQVVVKVLRQPGAVEGGPRDEAEYACHRLAAQRSSCVARVSDWGFTDHLRTRFLVLDLLAGGTLDSALRHSGWPLAARLVAFDRLLDTVRALHDATIVHGDLKLANIGLARPDDIRSIRVIDFGLAQMLAPNGLPLPAPGTPGMRAPEQTRAGAIAIGPATDVFALAYAAVGLLWGRGHAYRLGQDTEAGRPHFRPPMLNDGLRERLRVGLRLSPSMPRLLALVQHMIAPRPQDRPTAAEAQREFRAICGAFFQR